MTLAVGIKQCKKVNLFKQNTPKEAKAPFCVPLPVLSRCQAERAQGLYPDTTVIHFALILDIMATFHKFDIYHGS